MRRVFLAAVILVSAACGPAADTGPAVPVVTDAWATPTREPTMPWAQRVPEGALGSDGYAVIRNPGGVDDKLVSASSPRAARVDIDLIVVSGGAMHLGDVGDGVVIPARGEVVFEPAGHMLALLDTDGAFAIGDEIPVTLTFEHGGDVDAVFEVRQLPWLEGADE